MNIQIKQIGSITIIGVLVTIGVIYLLKPKSNVEYVDVFVGTSGDHGQLDPSATIPFGQIKVGPDTETQNHGGYNFENAQLRGFSINRISGVGCYGAGGNLRIKPLTTTGITQIVNIDKKNEIAYPGYYSALLSNGVFAEMTASRAVAFQRYIFPKTSERVLSVDLHSSFANFFETNYRQISDTEISGSVSAANVCDEGRYTVFFHIETKEPFILNDLNEGLLFLDFKGSLDNTVELRIAVSSIDVETAAKENQLLVESFNSVKKQAYNQWKDKMDKIDVYGDETDKKLFYSMLYRVYHSPVDITSFDGRYRGADGIVYRIKNRRFYSSWSIWDTYRTKFPLLNLIEPEVMSDISNSLIELYKQGKSDWATIHEPTPTVRTEHAMIVLLDAIEKGIRNINIDKEAYKAMKEEAERLSIDSPDKLLECAYDLWALSRIAGKLGYIQDSIKYANRSHDMWKAIWIEKFKTINPETFDIVHGDGLYEGTLWQYRWAVPYVYDEMAEIVGGNENLKNELTYFFESNLHNVGNQPGIHTPFIFNKLNDNVSTNKWVHEIIKGNMKHYYGTHQKNEVPYIGRVFKPELEAFIPEMDDDDGTMSAWYVFASTGLYPLLPGSSEYELLMPVFDRIVFKLPNNKLFTIINNSSKIYSEKTYSFNNEMLSDFLIDHRRINEGGVLVISDKD